MWIAIAILVVGYIIYQISIDHNEHVETNITNYGGMKEKYSILINHLTQYPTAKITRITKQSIEISSPTINYYIDVVGYNTEIRMKGFLPGIGNFTKKWKYPLGYSQEKIIVEIENFVEWKLQEYTKFAQNNFFKYTNEIKD